MTAPLVDSAPASIENGPSLSDWHALATELNVLQEEVAALQARLAEQETELNFRRQQHIILTSLWQCARESLGARLLEPFRKLVRLVRPRGADERHLLTWQQLEAGDEPGAWNATGPAPQFLVPCLLPAGWVRFRLRMHSEDRVLVKLFADRGRGFHPIQFLERIAFSGDLEHEFYYNFDEPVRAIRLDPRDGVGFFRVDSFQVEPVPGPRLWLRALLGKLMLLRSAGRTPHALVNGLKLLLRGRFKTLIEKLLHGVPAPSIHPTDWANTNQDYQLWRQQRRLTSTDRHRISLEIKAMLDPPKISVLCPVHNVPEKYLRLAIESVRRQLYPHWELCLVDDGSSASHVRPVLEEYARLDDRIKLAFHPERRNISAASNTALEMATGEFVALLDHDDELAEHALYRMAREIRNRPDADMFYSDEDKLDQTGRHVEPFFKPDWSPEFFLACMYTCHLGVYRTERVRAIGGFRGQYDLAQDYDLVLRLSSSGANIAHVSDVLYHWRKLPGSTASGHQAKEEAEHVARRALQEHIERTGKPGRVEPGPLPGLHRVRYALQGRPKVSILIPSACKQVDVRGRRTYLLLPCIESIRKLTTYDNYEIIVLNQPGMPDRLRRALDKLGVRCLDYSLPFNWSRVNNEGAAQAAGDYLLFLNDDTEILTPDWLESMLEFAQQPEIGAVGARLLFPDGRLQHIGINLLDGVPGHPYYQYPGEYSGYFGSAILHRNCSAVTGACLMTRRDIFEALGGFDTDLDLNYSDVDYCLKAVETGKRIVYAPDAQLCHHESLTKPGVFDHEIEAFRALWAARIPRDPFYNPNLSVCSFDYRIDIEPTRIELVKDAQA